MKHELHSPLAAVRFADEAGTIVSVLDTLGAAVDLMRHLPFQGRLSVDSIANHVITAVQEGRCRMTLTEDLRPYGLATWLRVPQAQHARWLVEGAPSLSSIGAATETSTDLAHGGSPLWFGLLLTPFTTPLPLLRELQTHHAMDRAAWALNPDGAGFRQVW
jgi:hemolysin-activating ACP:hemolysin acyltransferase